MKRLYLIVMLLFICFLGCETVDDSESGNKDAPSILKISASTDSSTQPPFNIGDELSIIITISDPNIDIVTLYAKQYLKSNMTTPISSKTYDGLTQNVPTGAMKVTLNLNDLAGDYVLTFELEDAAGNRSGISKYEYTLTVGNNAPSYVIPYVYREGNDSGVYEHVFSIGETLEVLLKITDKDMDVVKVYLNEYDSGSNLIGSKTITVEQQHEAEFDFYIHDIVVKGPTGVHSYIFTAEDSKGNKKASSQFNFDVN